MMTTDTNEPNTSIVELATELTISWLSNPNTRASIDDVPAFLKSMYETVAGLEGAVNAAPAEATTHEYVPAVSVRKSLASKDHIISMIDGRPYKSLRRHLTTNGMTPEQYRERYNLKADYPMVSESYSATRRALAKQIGLGRKAKQADEAPAEADPEVPAPKKRGRKLSIVTA